MGDRLLEPKLQKGSYYHRVTVPCIGRWRRHRLVGETWLNAKPDECILHKDEELPPELIDSVDNLWLGDRVDNYKDRDNKGRLKGTWKRCIPQQVRKKVWSLRKLGLITREIADIVGLNIHAVHNILHRDDDTNIYVSERIV